MELDDYLEDYVKFKEMNHSNNQAAAIIGHDGRVWAQTTNFPGQLTTKERRAIMREFDKPGRLTMTGLYLGGTKYVVVGVEPGDVIRACRKYHDGVIIKKTRAALVIGCMYDSRWSSVIVEKVGEDLIKKGY